MASAPPRCPLRPPSGLRAPLVASVAPWWPRHWLHHPGGLCVPPGGLHAPMAASMSPHGGSASCALSPCNPLCPRAWPTCEHCLGARSLCPAPCASLALVCGGPRAKSLHKRANTAPVCQPHKLCPQSSPCARPTFVQDPRAGARPSCKALVQGPRARPRALTLKRRARNLFFISRKFPFEASPLKGSLMTPKAPSFWMSVQRA